ALHSARRTGSNEPPGGNGRIRMMGLLGNVSARAGRAAVTPAAAAAAANKWPRASRLWMPGRRVFSEKLTVCLLPSSTVRQVTERAKGARDQAAALVDHAGLAQCHGVVDDQ